MRLVAVRSPQCNHPEGLLADDHRRGHIRLKGGNPGSTDTPVAPRISIELRPIHDQVMHTEYVRAVGRMAYVWGWALVNMWNRRAGITQAPEPGRLGGVVPVAPRGRIGMLNDYVLPDQSFVACPNQDVAYGLGYFSLDEEPVVIQVSDFGDRFWVCALYDARTEQFGELGMAYSSEPGFYLLVGPEWDGDVPDGIAAVIRCPTELAMAGPRVFLDDTDEDRAALRPLVNQIDAYPLREYDGRTKVTDWGSVPSFPAPEAEGERSWVVPDAFFAQLPTVMDAVAPLPGEEGLYAVIRQVLDSAAADPALADILTEVAARTEAEVIQPLFRWRHNGVPAGNGWNRSVNNAEWGFNYLMRTATAKSNMFENRSAETQYFFSDADSEGAQLEGAHQYAITFAAGELPPVNGFWSLTLYDEHHLFALNELGRYSLGTKNKDLVFDEDGSLTLYAGAAAPDPTREANWLPAPAGAFSLYIRCYWAMDPVLDGRWTPPRIERLH